MERGDNRTRKRKQDTGVSQQHLEIGRGESAAIDAYVFTGEAAIAAKSIAIAGKGGTGKTTITALITLYLLNKHAGPVLAIDADPDANLGKMLGVQVERTVGDVREEVLRDIKNIPAGMPKAAYMEAGLHQIITESKGFDLLTMGRGEGPGCYCALNNLIRTFASGLLSSYAWVVMDNEAGLEHLSRRTTADIDTLLVVVTESPLSFDTAKNIESIAGSIKNDIRRTFLVSSMVRPEKLAVIKERAARHSSAYIGNVARDSVIEDAILEGRGLLTISNSVAFENTADIMTRLYSAA